MEQDIRFCTASDGVRIAYATVGKGPPLVRVLGWFTHLEHDWTAPWVKSDVEGLARRYTYIRYDGRGTGLSDRDVDDFSIESRVKDLEAVIDASGQQQVAFFAVSQGGPIAIKYSARHPERVSHLILYGSFAHMPPPRSQEAAEMRDALVTLVRQGWGKDSPAFRMAFTSMFLPNADPERLQWFNEMQRASATPETAANLLTQQREFDVRDLLPKLTVPTLVFHARGDQAVPFKRGRELAAEIPNARFVPLESDNHVMTTDEPAYAMMEQSRDEFLAASADAGASAAVAATSPTPAVPPAPAAPARAAQPAAPVQSGSAPVSGGLVTILFTDMESSTALTQRVGDASAQEVRRAHNDIVRAALAASGGNEIKHTGDGIMASFSGATAALDCAIAIQRGVAEHRSAEPDSPLAVYVGLNAGEPIAENGPDGRADLFGTSVDLAKRVCDAAEPGQVLVSDVIRQLAAGKQFLFSDRGDTVLRGFEDPVKLWELSWEDQG